MPLGINKLYLLVPVFRPVAEIFGVIMLSHDIDVGTSAGPPLDFWGCSAPAADTKNT